MMKKSKIVELFDKQAKKKKSKPIDNKSYKIKMQEGLMPTIKKITEMQLKQTQEQANKEFDKAKKEIKKEHKEQNEFEALRLLVLGMLVDKKRADASETIVAAILKHQHIYTTRDDEHSEMWIYHDGIYVPQAKTYIQEFVRNILETQYTTALCNLVIDKIKADTYIKQEDFFKEEQPYLVAVKNGILNLKDKSLKQFKPDYRFFNKMPITYDPSKKNPKIIKFFDSLFKDKGEIEVIQEIFGYLPYREYFLEKSFMFLGNGRNGKGKTLDLMKRFLGADNCAEISLESMEGDLFSIGELFKKQANLCGDLSRTALKHTGHFKKLTGRDLNSAPRKFKTRVHFENYAKMIFSANSLPVTYDITKGFFSRWIILDFPYTFMPQKEIERLKEIEKKNVKLRDPDIIEHITDEDEMSGLLNWALKGLERLYKNKVFSYSPSTNETEVMWLRKSNSFSAFCMDCLEEEYNAMISKTDLKKIYWEYCREHKIAGVSDKVIIKILSEMFGASEDRPMIDGKRMYVWIGFKLKEGNKLYEIDYIDYDTYRFYTYSKNVKNGIEVKQGGKLGTIGNPNLNVEKVPQETGVFPMESVVEEQIRNEILQKCYVCASNPSHYWDDINGKPICEVCYESKKKMAQRALN